MELLFNFFFYFYLIYFYIMLIDWFDWLID